MDTFLRDNRLLPPLLALLALFVFAWVVAGVFVGGRDEQEPVAHRSEIAQADSAGDSNPSAPEMDNPNVDSYAAYRSKDPFRQILVFARTTPEDTTTGGGGTGDGRPGGGRGADTDRDGLPDRMEAKFGQEPSIPDTDGDGIPDGLDDSNGDGIPDGVEGSAAAGGGNNRAGGNGGGRGAGDRPGRGGGGRGGGLLDSGGILSPP